MVYHENLIDQLGNLSEIASNPDVVVFLPFQAWQAYIADCSAEGKQRLRSFALLGPVCWSDTMHGADQPPESS